eukprot:scaffold652839_cov80-Prasinocladus_malaysianus.AAC.1
MCVIRKLEVWKDLAQISLLARVQVLKSQKPCSKDTCEYVLRSLSRPRFDLATSRLPGLKSYV